MKRFFDLKLYVEGLKKVRILGIICCLLLLLTSILPPLITTINKYSDGAELGNDFPLKALAVAASLLPVLLFAPIIVMNMFSFLTNRNSSDFYHSLPFTRHCTFLSLFAACLTWIWGAIIVAWSIISVMWQVLPFYDWTPSEFLPYLPAYLSATLMLMGFASIAVSVTGTKFSCFTVFVILTAALRGYFAIFSRTLDVVIPSLTYSDGPLSVIAIENYMPISIILHGFEIGYVSGITNIWCHIYSFTAGTVLLLSGCLLYSKRNSEGATRFSAGNGLRIACRTLLSLPIALVGAYKTLTLFASAYGSYSGDTIFVSSIITLFVSAVIVWFMLEIIFTKNLTSVFRAALQLPILVGLCLVYMGGILVLRHTTLDFKPTPEQVESVQISFPNLANDTQSYVFEANNIATVSTTAEDTKKLVCDYINSEADKIADRSMSSYESYTMVITLHMENGKTIRRNCHLYSHPYDTMYALSLSSEDIAEQFLKLPSGKYSYFGGIEAFVLRHGLKNLFGIDDPKELWLSYCDDYSKAPVEERFLAKTIDSDQTLFPGIQLVHQDGRGRPRSNYSIPASFISTRQMIIDCHVQQEHYAARRTNMLAILNKFSAGNYEDFDNEIKIHISSNGKDLYSNAVAVYEESFENTCFISYSEFSKIAQLILDDPLIESTPSAEASYIAIELYIDKENPLRNTRIYDYYYEHACSLMAVSDETAAEIAKLLSPYGMNLSE